MANYSANTWTTGDLISKTKMDRLEAGTAAALPSADAPELIRDTIGTALTAGSGITVTPNDGADTITVAATGLATLASPTFTGTVTLPKVVSTPVSVTYAATTTIDASLGSRFKITATGASTLAAPTNPTDGQQITVVILASGADRALTISGSILLTTGLSASVTVLSGKRQILGLVYLGDLTAWVLLASTQIA